MQSSGAQTPSIHCSLAPLKVLGVLTIQREVAQESFMDTLGLYVGVKELGQRGLLPFLLTGSRLHTSVSPGALLTFFFLGCIGSSLLHAGFL